MEDTNVQRESAAGRFTWLWMIAAVVLIGLFMVWLGATTEPSQVSVVEEEAEEDSSIVTVPVDTFATRSDSYVGQEIRLRDLPVASLLGPRMFWTQLPGDQEGITTPYLLALDSALVADSVAVQSGETVTVVGQVHSVTDSVLTEWIETGTITEAQRIEAEFATSYFEVRRMRRPGSQDGGSSSEES